MHFTKKKGSRKFSRWKLQLVASPYTRGKVFPGIKKVVVAATGQNDFICYSCYDILKNKTIPDGPHGSRKRKYLTPLKASTPIYGSKLKRKSSTHNISPFKSPYRSLSNCTIESKKIAFTPQHTPQKVFADSTSLHPVCMSFLSPARLEGNHKSPTDSQFLQKAFNYLKAYKYKPLFRHLLSSSTPAKEALIDVSCSKIVEEVSSKVSK